MGPDLGQTLQSYGWPWDKRYFSQMNINYWPGRELSDDSWRMDYPREAKSPLIATVRLGVVEPSLGCLLDFRPAENGGWAGLGVGVQGTSSAAAYRRGTEPNTGA